MAITAGASSERPGSDRRALCRLRRAYFSRGGLVASRYGVGFDRLVQHLWEARRGQRRMPLDAIRHVEDLVHAVACLDAVALAWSDLAEQYERSLVRRCAQQLGPTDSIIAVRQLLNELRRRCEGPSHILAPSLRSYRGITPLRSWLSERLIALITRERMRLSTSFAGRGRPVRQAQHLTGPWLTADPVETLTPAGS